MARRPSPALSTAEASAAAAPTATPPAGTPAAAPAGRGAAAASPASPAAMLGALIPRNGATTAWAMTLRPGVNYGLQSVIAWIKAAEEWQRAQLDGVHLALHRHEQVHRQLGECTDAAELAGLQAELWRFDGANALHVSQRAFDCAMHLNTALLRAWAEWVLGGRSQWTRGFFEGLQSGLHTGFRPLDEIFNAPLQRELFGALREHLSGNGAAAGASTPAHAPVNSHADLGSARRRGNGARAAGV